MNLNYVPVSRTPPSKVIHFTGEPTFTIPDLMRPVTILFVVSFLMISYVFVMTSRFISWYLIVEPWCLKIILWQNCQTTIVNLIISWIFHDIIRFSSRCHFGLFMMSWLYWYDIIDSPPSEVGISLNQSDRHRKTFFLRDFGLRYCEKFSTVVTAKIYVSLPCLMMASKRGFKFSLGSSGWTNQKFLLFYFYYFIFISIFSYFYAPELTTAGKIFLENSKKTTREFRENSPCWYTSLICLKRTTRGIPSDFLRLPGPWTIRIIPPRPEISVSFHRT